MKTNAGAQPDSRASQVVHEFTNENLAITGNQESAYSLLSHRGDRSNPGWPRQWCFRRQTSQARVCMFTSAGQGVRMAPEQECVSVQGDPELGHLLRMTLLRVSCVGRGPSPETTGGPGRLRRDKGVSCNGKGRQRNSGDRVPAPSAVVVLARTPPSPGVCHNCCFKGNLSEPSATKHQVPRACPALTLCRD